MIEEFWIVTVSGALYFVKRQEGIVAPRVEKIYQMGDSGAPVGTCLTGGSALGLTKQAGAVLYFAKGLEDGSLKPCWETNTAYWGGHTSPIVGLFEDEELAKGALRRDLIAWDWRWLAPTLRTLKKIGEHDPDFSIDPPLREMVQAVGDRI